MSSPSLEPLELAFLLVNPQGNPYNTSIDIVELPPKSDVCDFRDVVKAENSNKLAGISSSQLTVYKNKAAFDAGEEPLDPLSFLDKMLIFNEMNALIVVVPKLSTGMLHC
jgi:hypothetical protein